MTPEPARDNLVLGHPPTQERQTHRHHAADTGNQRFVIDAARLMSDSHCEDVIIFDVRGLSDVADYIIIGSGTSDRQIRSVGDDVQKLAKTVGLPRFGRDIDDTTTWDVLDFVDVIVHIFEPATRAHYDLEMLWGDAPQVAWRRDKPHGA